MAQKIAREQEFIDTLCTLTMAPPAELESAIGLLNSLDPEERESLLSLANSHHIILRALTPVTHSTVARRDLQIWASNAIASEQARIGNALTHLEGVCNELERSGCQVTVMKTLDHWPDMGNDCDLYSTASERDICRVMTQKFNAKIEPRSWGDRLAHKWNFAVPGLPEAIEVHVQRLGQTGEHTELARRFVTRRVPKTVLGKTFWVPAPEERIVVATLQRMYRHFYFRICDILNSAAIAESGELDFTELKRISEYAGIWPGVATYLVIVSDKMKAYRGIGVALPQFVLEAARFGGSEIKVNASFLRVPIKPYGMRLYMQQITQTAFRGDVPATFRLSLLPPLASAAAIAYKFTGSDKGIW
jgi:hypothetical protein